MTSTSCCAPAATSVPTDDDALRAAVRETYAAVATAGSLSCCTPAGDVELSMIGDAYDGVDGYVAEADLGLGCGLPVEHAGLAPGQTVLDLGAGAGLDAFVARRIVGEAGRVIGLDFTPEMIEKARANAATLGYTNVEFILGDIEAMPVADASVDVIISNCVLNLVPDKARAFAETFRVLRPGGHVCVSDVVTRGELPAPVRASAALYAGCIGGVVEREAYLALWRVAGFEGVEVVAERRLDIPEAVLPAMTEAERAAWKSAGLYSVTVRATRPAEVAAVTAEAPALRVFDPPQCCATGVCGSDVDPALVQFASDLRALEAGGVAVERFNLAQQPEAFLAEPVVVQTVNTLGTGVLPLVVVGGRIVSHSRYPSRAELEAMASVEPEPPFGLDMVAAGPSCAPGSDCC